MQRTPLQNKSLHKYIAMLAEQMDSAGYDMRQVITVPIRPNPDNVKEEMVRPVINIMFPQYRDEEGNVSSTKLSTTEMQEFYLIMDRAMTEKLQIHIEWPSEESLSHE